MRRRHFFQGAVVTAATPVSRAFAGSPRPAPLATEAELLERVKR